MFVSKISPATQTRSVSKKQNFSIVKWPVSLITCAFERSNSVRTQIGGWGVYH